MKKFLKKALVPTIFAVLFATYVYVAGTTRSCAACSAVTGIMGLNPDGIEAQAAQQPSATEPSPNE